MIIPELHIPLPLIDISPFLARITPENAQVVQSAKKASAELMDKACREVGFFYLIGHGVPESELNKAHELAQQFFARPDQEKEAISILKGDFARGYQRLGQNITQYAKDWHEGLDLYAPVHEEHPLRKRNIKTLTGVNMWPAHPPEFQTFFEHYIETMKTVGMATMKCMAMALGLDESFFVDKLDDSFWVMRIIGYPPLTQAQGENVGISCGQHTDYGCLTLLNQDWTRDALQVLSKNGEWINANRIEGALVVNIGDMVNVWTNNLYKSTLHRVIHKGNNYRVSIPFFFEPNFDAMIEPLPKCVNETGGVALHHPVMYGDHLLGKVTNNFELK